MSLAQLSQLLSLPEEELKQVLDYAATLSEAEVIEHFGNLLGDSPDALDFIASFNLKRRDSEPPRSQFTSAGSSTIEPVPKSSRNQRNKKKAPVGVLPPRQIANPGPAPGTAYSKKNAEDDYITRKGNAGPSSISSAKPAPEATPGKLPPSASGHLISDVSRGKQKSASNSRSSTPKPKPNVHVNISGGTAMHGASGLLSDLDAAIRSLEMSTNPTKDTNADARRCNCVAARHPLLAAAPNCLKCGKVICVREGLGPCTFCGTPLLSSSETQDMIRELKDERGRERMAADREAHKKAAVSRTPAPFSKPRENADSTTAENKALEHRDRLLEFQAQNAQRTTVKDEAADFDVGGAASGSRGNMWTSPEERARELKRQQKILREMEWNARPDYEKRRQVVSIDLVGGKVVRKMAAVERPVSLEDDESTGETEWLQGKDQNSRGGSFSKNPLLDKLIKPIYDADGKGSQLEGRKDRKRGWGRVQDNLDDNEDMILDGGLHGGPTVRADTTRSYDEPVCG